MEAVPPTAFRALFAVCPSQLLDRLNTGGVHDKREFVLVMSMGQ